MGTTREGMVRGDREKFRECVWVEAELRELMRVSEGHWYEIWLGVRVCTFSLHKDYPQSRYAMNCDIMFRSV